MSKTGFPLEGKMISLDLKRDFADIRDRFPILESCVYLISNSLGAVPSRVADDLMAFYRLWAERGVRAWEETWWDLARNFGNELASFLGAGDDEITMMPNATVAHWTAISTQFADKGGKRKKIVMTDHDFPSSIYAVSEIAKTMGWAVDLIRSDGDCGIDTEHILDRIDESTLFVATSHVYFKSGYIQWIEPIIEKARRVGALTLIDGYHAPGTIPVRLSELRVDFYVGGCLKWLCGGPGNAFLFVRKDLSAKIAPSLTGWFAHRKPFSFSERMLWAEGAHKFMSGTPSIPSLYTASAGLDIINSVGIEAIRDKSLKQTGRIIQQARQRGFPLFSPEEEKRRGGAVSIVLPHGYQVKQALGHRGILVDFRKGKGREPDTLRVGPHFYTLDDEIDRFFSVLDEIYSTKEYKTFPVHAKTVT
jgi:kynureninase